MLVEEQSCGDRASENSISLNTVLLEDDSGYGAIRGGAGVQDKEAPPRRGPESGFQEAPEEGRRKPPPPSLKACDIEVAFRWL